MISNRWKLAIAALPIIGTLALAQPQPGGLAFFQAWWGAKTAFEPMDIEGMEWWIDASDAESISLQAGTNLVSQWNDKSGNARHLTQGASASRPKWIESEVNNLAVIQFDGSQFMDVPASTNMFNFLHQTNSTVFMVIKPSLVNTNPNNVYVILDNSAFGGNPAGVTFAYDDRDSLSRSNAAIARVWANGVASIVLSQTANNTLEPTIVSLFTHISRPLEAVAANRSEIYINDGSAIKFNSSTAAVSASSASSLFTIGKNSDNNFQYLVGQICEIIIYRGSLEETSLSLMRSYLNKKWSIY